MSTDISHIEILRAENAHFAAADWYKLTELREDDRLPGCNMLDAATHGVRGDPVKKGKVAITRIWWSGEGSGRSLDFFISEFVSKMKGEIWAVLTWERGNALEAWHIKDGHVRSLDLYKTMKSSMGFDGLTYAMAHAGEDLDVETSAED